MCLQDYDTKLETDVNWKSRRSGVIGKIWMNKSHLI